MLKWQTQDELKGKSLFICILKYELKIKYKHTYTRACI